MTRRTIAGFLGALVAFVVWAAPASANGLLYLTDVGGGLTARDASSGAYVWGALVTNLGVESSPSVAGDVVYVGDATWDVKCET